MTGKILLVDLDKDYIRRVENGADFRLNHDLFQEAVVNLEQDIKYWTAESGIVLTLQIINEVISETHNKYPVSRSHTRVYAVTESEDDVAWIKLSLGQLDPATRLTHGQVRGWQFQWAPAGSD